MQIHWMSMFGLVSFFISSLKYIYIYIPSWIIQNLQSVMIGKFLSVKIIWLLLCTLHYWFPYSLVFKLPIKIQFKSYIFLKWLFQSQEFGVGRRQGLFFHSVFSQQWRWSMFELLSFLVLCSFSFFWVCLLWCRGLGRKKGHDRNLLKN